MSRRFLIVQATFIVGAIAAYFWQQGILAGGLMACAALVSVAFHWHKNQ
jgi:hypothetical protein